MYKEVGIYIPRRAQKGEKRSRGSLSLANAALTSYRLTWSAAALRRENIYIYLRVWNRLIYLKNQRNTL